MAAEAGLWLSNVMQMSCRCPGARLGLALAGALFAAPLGALITKKLPRKAIMIIVGVLIIFLQLRTLYQTWF